MVVAPGAGCVVPGAVVVAPGVVVAGAVGVAVVGGWIAGSDFSPQPAATGAAHAAASTATSRTRRVPAFDQILTGRHGNGGAVRTASSAQWASVESGLPG